MSFRYLNPGLVSLLDSNSTATQSTDPTYSKTGSSLQLEANKSFTINLPAITSCSDIWIRFDGYFSNRLDIFFHIPYAEYEYDYVTVVIEQDKKVSGRVNWAPNGYGRFTGFASDNNVVERNAVNRFLFHIKYGSYETFYCDFSLNGSDAQRATFSGEGGIYFAPAYNFTTFNNPSSQGIFISNIIISDEPLLIDEQVITLPVSTTDTDMTESGGLYTATDAGQTILQTPDVADLIATYYGAPRVTGVMVSANPAYRTGEDLKTLTSIDKTGGTITDHNSFILGLNTHGAVKDGRSLSNTNLSDLADMQFGWKVGV